MTAIILVIEVLSVIAQILSFKITGNRILKMAPIHHHFELSGWSCSQILLRSWLVSCFALWLAIEIIR